MAKQNKTFKLDNGTIAIIQQLTGLLQTSQAKVIRMAVEKAYGDHQAEQKMLMEVYEKSSRGIKYLEAIRDSEKRELDKEQEQLLAFLNDVWDKARKMPQFPDWAG